MPADSSGLEEWNRGRRSGKDTDGAAPGYRRSGKSSGGMASNFQTHDAKPPSSYEPATVHSELSPISRDERTGRKAEAAGQAAMAGGPSEDAKHKPAFDRNGPVEAVALQSDWQFWNIFSDVRTIGKGHFAKVKQVMHNESREHFAAKILDKALADNDIEDLVCIRRLRWHPARLRSPRIYPVRTVRSAQPPQHTM